MGQYKRIANLKGPTGPAGTFKSASAEVVPSEQQAAVEMSGPDGSRHVHFKIPRGLSGTDGVPTTAVIEENVTLPGVVRDALDSRFQRQANRKLAIIGDSLTWAGGLIPGLESARTRGWWVWALSMVNHNFDVINRGVSGWKSADLVTDIPGMLADEPGQAMLMIGANDINEAVAIGDYQANVTAVLDALESIGCPVVVVTPTARATYTGAQRTLQLLVQSWLLSLDRPGVEVVDGWGATGHPAVGTAVAGYLYDGLHLTALGASAVGRAAAPAVERLVKQPRRLAVSDLDTDNHCKGRFASRHPGTLLPVNWAELYGDAGRAGVTYGYAPRTDGTPINWFQVTKTSDTSQSHIGCGFVTTTPGEVWEAAVEYEVEGLASVTGKGTPGIRIEFFSETNVNLLVKSYLGISAQTESGGMFDRSGVFFIPPTVAPADAVKVRLVLVHPTNGVYRWDRATLVRV